MQLTSIRRMAMVGLAAAGVALSGGLGQPAEAQAQSMVRNAQTVERLTSQFRQVGRWETIEIFKGTGSIFDSHQPAGQANCESDARDRRLQLPGVTQAQWHYDRDNYGIYWSERCWMDIYRVQWVRR